MAGLFPHRLQILHTCMNVGRAVHFLHDSPTVMSHGAWFMRDSEDSYRALLAVTNVLNSQRDTDSLWHAITEQIRKVLAWQRAGVTLYHPESDSFRFYALETSMPTRVLQRDAVIPRVG